MVAYVQSELLIKRNSNDADIFLFSSQPQSGKP